MSDFSARLLAWFERHGRHDLPWQKSPTAYRVWVSEIMLQQTQVATVVPYFERFMARFPDIRALAAAPLDEVLGYWSGLGYYARARNLHKAARIAVDEHGGELPLDRDGLEALPGIGRSTAAAILALSRNEPHAILDGNVKRVLARFHAIEGWPGKAAVLKEHWRMAESHVPATRAGPYTQAIMDLGATLCTRARPRCGECPVASDCAAFRDGRQGELPASKPRRERPHRKVSVLVVRRGAGDVLLERRPAAGVWGGLYSFPELAAESTAGEWCDRHLGTTGVAVEPLAVIAHSFTHFDLDIEPLVVSLDRPPAAVMDREDWLWYKPGAPIDVGVPAPVATLLRTMAHQERKAG